MAEEVGEDEEDEEEEGDEEDEGACAYQVHPVDFRYRSQIVLPEESWMCRRWRQETRSPAIVKSLVELEEEEFEGEGVVDTVKSPLDQLALCWFMCRVVFSLAMYSGWIAMGWVGLIKVKRPIFAVEYVSIGFNI